LVQFTESSTESKNLKRIPRIVDQLRQANLFLKDEVEIVNTEARREGKLVPCIDLMISQRKLFDGVSGGALSQRLADFVIPIFDTVG
jgi:hypothetical protein